jgi:predicted DNA-binding protein (UPF0251 family)
MQYQLSLTATNLMNHSGVSTKNQILTKLWDDPRLVGMLSRFKAGAGQDDLKSELFAVLCNQPEQKIIDLDQRKELMYFATGIVQRMIFQPNSKFHRTYRLLSTEYSDNHEQPEEVYNTERDQQEEKILEVIDKELHWAEAQMMHIYLKEGTLKKASEKTGISTPQVKKMVQAARKKIHTVYNGKLMGNYIVSSLDFVLDVNSEVSPETVMDLMDEVQDFIQQRLTGQKIPTKNGSDAFIKEIKPAKIKKVI